MTEQQLLLLIHSNSFIFFHTYPLKGFPKKVTPLLFNFIPFLQITIILLYDQKMFSCLRISYQSTSWYWMKQFVTTWNKVFWLSYYFVKSVMVDELNIKLILKRESAHCYCFLLWMSATMRRINVEKRNLETLQNMSMADLDSNGWLYLQNLPRNYPGNKSNSWRPF